MAVPVEIKNALKRYSSYSLRQELKSRDMRERQKVQKINGNYNGQKAKRDGCNGQERRRARQYGMTPAGFQELLDVQKNRCCICREVMTKPCVDHDHVTGFVRALLCSWCNSGLGMFKDDPSRLTNAIKYLQAFRKTHEQSIN